MKFVARCLRKVGRLGDYLVRPELFALRRRGFDVPLYERLTAPWLAARQFATVIDIGANEGQFAEVALKAFPRAQIMAFEPLPDCHQRLLDKFQHESRLRTFNLALADLPGDLEFHRHAFTPASSFLKLAALQARAFPHTVDSAVVKVQRARLDDAIAYAELNRPIFMKIDVQGYEAKVIEGGKETIGITDVVMVECAFQPMYEEQPSALEIINQMVGAGFCLAGIMDQMVAPESGRPLQADLLFSRALGALH